MKVSQRRPAAALEKLLRPANGSRWPTFNSRRHRKVFALSVHTQRPFTDYVTQRPLGHQSQTTQRSPQLRDEVDAKCVDAKYFSDKVVSTTG